MSDTDLTGESEPEERMAQFDEKLQERVEDAQNNERDPDYNGSESVENNDVDDMMAHL